MCIAETKVDESVNDEDLKIPNFEIVARLDSLPNSKSRGMILYMRKDSGHPYPDIFAFRRERTEILEMKVSGLKVCFVYIHPKASNQDIDNLNDTFRSSDLVIGDLNINSLNEGGSGLRKMMQVAEEAGMTSVLEEMTSNRCSQPDHILLKNDFSSKYVAASYKNLYSDHKSITFRKAALDDVELKTAVQESKYIKFDERHECKENIECKTGQKPKETEKSMKNKIKYKEDPIVIDDNDTYEQPDTDIAVFDEISGFKIYKRDMMTLNGQNWVRDNIVDLYLLLCTRGKKDQLSLPWDFFNRFSQPDKTIGYNNVKRVTQNIDIFSLKLLLVPIHLTNHWMLVSVENLYSTHISVKLYDPKYSDKYKFVLNEIHSFLEMEHSIKKGTQLQSDVSTTVEGCNIPLQQNDHDCGIFLCQFGKCLALNLPMDFVETDMPDLRIGMKRELKHKMVENKILKPIPKGSVSDSRLSSRKPLGSKLSFQNKSGTMCWLNSSLQLVVRALDIKGEYNIDSNLGKSIDNLRKERVPKNGFNAKYIRDILCRRDEFQHMNDGQQCVFEFFQAINQTIESGEKLCPEVAKLFQFMTNQTNICATCGSLRETQQIENNYLDIHLPNKTLYNLVDLETFKNLVENYFDSPVYRQDRFGCEIHPNSGALSTEILVSNPEFFIVVIHRIEADNGEDGLLYFTRQEEIQIPNTVTIRSPHGPQVYELFGIINWDGYASPTTGRTNGHYTANIKYGEKWFNMNDNKTKEVKITTHTSRSAYVLGYTCYEP